MIRLSLPVVIIIAGLLIAGSVFMSNRSNGIMAIGDCVTEINEQNGGTMTPEQAWQNYADFCSKL